MLPCKILIVDDDRDDLDLLHSSFYEIGVKNIHTVESMREAIEFLKSAAGINILPKLIITDLNMPGQSGYDFLKFLKTTPHYMHIPVIIFSTSVSDKEIRKSLLLGAIDYIPKPVNLKDYVELAIKMNARIESVF